MSDLNLNFKQQGKSTFSCYLNFTLNFFISNTDVSYTLVNFMATNKCALNFNFIYKTQFLWSTNSPSMKIENVTNKFEGSRIILNNLIHACVFFDT